MMHSTQVNKTDKISASFHVKVTKHLVMIIFFLSYKLVAMASYLCYFVRYYQETICIP